MIKTKYLIHYVYSLHIAGENILKYSIKLLNEQNGRNALLLAANMGKLEVVEFLMKEGEDIHFKDNVRVYVQTDVINDGISRFLAIYFN